MVKAYVGVENENVSIDILVGNVGSHGFSKGGLNMFVSIVELGEFIRQDVARHFPFIWDTSQRSFSKPCFL